jgi:AcrR family transcriptional regulator
MNRHYDGTSEALLTAAHRLLAEDGPEALTVRRIAGEAGMSTMNVYSRFGGKDGVIDELYADGYRRLVAEIDAVPSTDDVVADLMKIAHTYRAFAKANPTYYGIMFRSAVPGYTPSPESVAVALGGLSRFVSRVKRGQELGQIVQPDNGCDPQEIAAWLWATCHGIISLELDGIADEYVSWESIFLNGMNTAIRGLHPSVAPAPLIAN